MRRKPVLFLFFLICLINLGLVVMIFRLAQVWLCLSPFYYADALFFGAVSRPVSAMPIFQLLKYAASYFFTTYLLLSQGRVGSFVFQSFFFFLAIILINFTDSISLFCINLLILGSFYGWIFFCTHRTFSFHFFTELLVWTASVAGLLSVVELYSLYDVHVGFWQQTDGIRSISTLLNPNNSGLYFGAALLVCLIKCYKFSLSKVLLMIPIMFGLLASRSRTAWLSLLLTLLIFLFSPKVLGRIYRFFRNKPSQLVAVLAILFCSGFVVLYGTFVIRVQPTYGTLSAFSAIARVNNIEGFVNSLGISAFLPDFYDQRVHFIQDSFYLVFVNTAGLFLSAITLVFLLVFFLRPWQEYLGRTPENDIITPLLLYYLIAGLSVSFFNSFPNNQLFFIILGCYLFRLSQSSRFNMERFPFMDSSCSEPPRNRIPH